MHILRWKRHGVARDFGDLIEKEQEFVRTIFSEEDVRLEQEYEDLQRSQKRRRVSDNFMDEEEDVPFEQALRDQEAAELEYSMMMAMTAKMERIEDMASPEL